MLDFSVDFFKVSLNANLIKKISTVIVQSNLALELELSEIYNKDCGFQIFHYLISQFIFNIFLFFNLFGFADLSSFLSTQTQKDSVVVESPLWQEVVQPSEVVVKGYNNPNDTWFFFIFLCNLMYLMPVKATLIIIFEQFQKARQQWFYCKYLLAFNKYQNLTHF